jgi:tRNA threonylcarbamoyladenosine biosynthesis protein TsaE
MSITFARGAHGEATAELDDESKTLEVGARLARALQPGLRIYLSGDLGAGKTTLVRGCLRALGYPGRVKSPTFSLVELYQFSSLYLYHFDFYRFEDPREWSDAGFRDAFSGSGVCIVEWPEKAAERLPAPDLRSTLAHAGAGRSVRIAAETEPGKLCIEELVA